MLVGSVPLREDTDTLFPLFGDPVSPVCSDTSQKFTFQEGRDIRNDQLAASVFCVEDTEVWRVGRSSLPAQTASCRYVPLERLLGGSTSVPSVALSVLLDYLHSK